jgi:hypothetical protein
LFEDVERARITAILEDGHPALKRLKIERRIGRVALSKTWLGSLTR